MTILLDRGHKHGVSLSHELQQFLFLFFTDRGKKYVSEIPFIDAVTYQKIYLEFRCSLKLKLVQLEVTEGKIFSGAKMLQFLHK